MKHVAERIAEFVTALFFHPRHCLRFGPRLSRSDASRVPGGDQMKRPGDAFNCNVCGVLKGATNHWRVLSLGTVKVKEDGDAPLWNIRELTISEWHSVLALADGVAHACGITARKSWWNAISIAERWKRRARLVVQHDHVLHIYSLAASEGPAVRVWIEYGRHGETARLLIDMRVELGVEEYALFEKTWSG